MALVEYSSSDDDTSSKAPSATRKRKRPESRPDELPPLPTNFHDLYATNARISTQDDPSLHGGRKRAVPHVEGNWQTHIYLEWYPTTTEAGNISTTIRQVQDSFPALQVQSLVQSELGTVLPLHISLSAPLVLRTEQRASVLESVIQAIDSCSLPRTIETCATGLDWAHNDNASRWFLVLRAARSEKNDFNRLLNSMNQAVAKHGLSQLYSEESVLPNKASSPFKRVGSTRQTDKSNETFDVSERFHISIAWTLDSPMKSRQQESSMTSIPEHISKDIKGLKIAFESVKIKIGNTITSIALSATRGDGTSILG